MGRNLDPKCKQCRRIGEKLYLKGEKCLSPKCAMVKKNYPPGYHGPKGYSKLSEYGLQLKEKQKARKIYILTEKQFHNYFKKASVIRGDTGLNLLLLLESRLDNVVYRLGFAKSRNKARQLVNHGLIFVNDKKVNISSYQVKTGDIITVKKTKLISQYFKDILKSISKHELPSWLAFLDNKSLQAKVIDKPKEEEIKQGIDTSLIIEFYSR